MHTWGPVIQGIKGRSCCDGARSTLCVQACKLRRRGPLKGHGVQYVFLLLLFHCVFYWAALVGIDVHVLITGWCVGVVALSPNCAAGCHCCRSGFVVLRQANCVLCRRCCPGSSACVLFHQQTQTCCICAPFGSDCDHIRFRNVFCIGHYSSEKRNS